jgi:DNA-binding PucR family transcriptional regulator
VLRHFLKRSAAALGQNRELAEAAEALVRSNMSLTPAAEALFVHRNTISQYMSRLRELLDLDPQHRDGDRYLLMLVCLYCRRYIRGGEGEL